MPHKPGTKPKQRRKNGFTLVEVMVVIVIIGLLSTVVIVNVLPVQDRGAIEKARGDIAAYSQALELFNAQHRTYPTTDQGLDALKTPPQGLRNPERFPSGGYIQTLRDDPWGNPYQYLRPGENKNYDIISLGADGRRGGEGLNADITN